MWHCNGGPTPGVDEELELDEEAEANEAAEDARLAAIKAVKGINAMAREISKSRQWLSNPFHNYTNVLWLISSATYGILAANHQEGSRMPRSSPFVIHLSVEEAHELKRRAAKYTLPYFEVQRARMILMASQGMSNDEIAARLDTRREVVSLWRKRFFKERLAGLEERARPGRPRAFPPRDQR